jgi:hypothetical protein
MNPVEAPPLHYIAAHKLIFGQRLAGNQANCVKIRSLSAGKTFANFGFGLADKLMFRHIVAARYCDP